MLLDKTPISLFRFTLPHPYASNLIFEILLRLGSESRDSCLPASGVKIGMESDRSNLATIVTTTTALGGGISTNRISPQQGGSVRRGNNSHKML